MHCESCNGKLISNHNHRMSDRRHLLWRMISARMQKRETLRLTMDVQSLKLGLQNVEEYVIDEDKIVS